MFFCKKVNNTFFNSLFLPIFASAQLAHHGFEGHILLVKGRLRTLSSAVKSRKLDYAQEDTATGTSTLGVLCTFLIMSRKEKYNISRRGLTAVAYPCA